MTKTRRKSRPKPTVAEGPSYIDVFREKLQSPVDQPITWAQAYERLTGQPWQPPSEAEIQAKLRRTT